MRYVFLAFAGIALAAVWLNTSSHGNKLRRHMMEHPAEPSLKD